MKNSKKITAILATSLALITAATTFAADYISVVLNGEKVIFNAAQPVIYEERTLIPVRAVFEDLGCYVDWDSANHMAVIGNEEKVIFIPIDSHMMRVYDIAEDRETEISLDVPAMIIDESTMIPLRAVGEALGAKVDWNQTNKTVSINI